MKLDERVDVTKADGTVRIREYQDDVLIGVSSLSNTEWAEVREQVKAMYNTDSRAACVDTIAALHLTFMER